MNYFSKMVSIIRLIYSLLALVSKKKTRLSFSVQKRIFYFFNFIFSGRMKGPTIMQVNIQETNSSKDRTLIETIYTLRQWLTQDLIKLVRSVIKMLLAPTAILELAMRRSVLGKNTLRLFPLRPSSLPVMVPSLTKDCKKKTKKSTLRWCGKTDAECLVHMNERSTYKT